MNEGGSNWDLERSVTFPSHPGQWHGTPRAAGLLGHVLDFWEFYMHSGESFYSGGYSEFLQRDFICYKRALGQKRRGDIHCLL